MNTLNKVMGSLSVYLRQVLCSSQPTWAYRMMVLIELGYRDLQGDEVIFVDVVVAHTSGVGSNDIRDDKCCDGGNGRENEVKNQDDVRIECLRFMAFSMRDDFAEPAEEGNESTADSVWQHNGPPVEVVG